MRVNPGLHSRFVSDRMVLSVIRSDAEIKDGIRPNSRRRKFCERWKAEEAEATMD